MSDPAPVVYLLHGEDEFAIAQFVTDLESRLGDDSIASMNITCLDGRTCSQDELVSAVSVMPFLAERRLVELTHPLARISGKADQEKFQALLERVPPTTALLLIFDQPLKGSPKDGKHWLERWAEKNKGRVFERLFTLPKGPAMGQWIQKRAKDCGGQFTPQAAQLLASLVGDDPRMADQEIQKLLAYVNYERPVDPEDVYTITPETKKLEDFALVNALRSGRRREAIAALQKALQEDDPLQILGSIIYQFRLMLLARSVLDAGGSTEQVVQELGDHLNVRSYPARIAADQARRYPSPVLEKIYRYLLDVDTAIKTGEVDASLALNQLVTQLTSL